MSEAYIVIFTDGSRAKVFAKDAGEALVEAGKSHGLEPIEVRAQADIKPSVGLVASHHIGSDTYAGRIVAMSRTGHRVTWQRVEADGNLRANFVKEYSRRRDGRYFEIGGKYGYLELGIGYTDLDEGF